MKDKQKLLGRPLRPPSAVQTGWSRDSSLSLERSSGSAGGLWIQTAARQSNACAAWPTPL